MMYGQMTAGSWIYIGTQGILQGTYETFAEAARQHFGGSLKGRLVVTAGLGGMGGAQPLAATMNERRADRRRGGREANRAAARDGLPRPVRRDRRRRARSRARGARNAGGRSRSALLGNAADVLARAGAARRHPRPRHRPDDRPRPAQRLRPQRHDVRGGPRAAGERARALHGRGAAQHGRARPGHARPQGGGLGRLRLRQQHPRRGAEGGRRRRLRHSRLRARLHPAAVLRGQGPVPLGLPLGRAGRPARDRRRRARDVPERRGSRALDPPRARAGQAPGTAGADLLAGLRRARAGWAGSSTSSCAAGA